jgi:hypothetical protein
MEDKILGILFISFSFIGITALCTGGILCNVEFKNKDLILKRLLVIGYVMVVALFITGVTMGVTTNGG